MLRESPPTPTWRARGRRFRRRLAGGISVICASVLLALTAPTAKAAALTLHATHAREHPGLKVFQASPSAAFHLSGELAETPMLRWDVRIPETGRYRIRLLVRCETGGMFALIRTGAGDESTGAAPLPRSWERQEAGVLPLAQGTNVIELRFKGRERPEGKVDIQAVELSRVDESESDEARATAARADTRWLRQAGFGVMLHWTRESAAFEGAAKPYAQAVADLDTEALARRLGSTGAGFVVFTTAHAFQDFPAPLASLEAALPGRTTKRDLVADLAKALKRQGMALMLYHNPGTAEDPAWTKAGGLAEPEGGRQFQLWQAIVTEAGNRYGEQLAGWWFDDGATRLYPRNAPWESLHRAARAGHPARLVGFNPWEFASVTDWQDFDCGEGLRDPRGREGLLPATGDGIYRSSSRKGQQATACVTLEDGWLHRENGRMPSPPTWNEAELHDFLSRSRQSGLVPILNLKITQEGLMNNASLELVRRAAQR